MSNAPKKNVYLVATIIGWVGVVAGVLGVVGANVPYITQYSFWLASIGFVVLWLGNTLKGM